MKKKRKFMKKIFQRKKFGKLIKSKSFWLLVIIFGFEIFLRFYQMDSKNPFGYDQVDNAWAAKNILVNHEFPLVGMVAKGNSNIYIGPIYYYLIAVSYWIFNMNPIASAVFAGATSIFNFWVIYFVVKNLFSKKMALIALFINTFFLPAILFDRVQWPVNFIPSISLLVFYFLYRVLLGDIKKLIHLSITVGLSFSVHFTSIFYPIIVLLSLPLLPRTKETLKYIFISIPLFLIFLIPNIVYEVQKASSGSNLTSYFNTYYHGFHLTRVKQLTGDALIEFNAYSFLNSLVPLKFIAIPIFFLLFLYKSVTRDKLIFCYLVILWFVVPWFVFATYAGELTDYYFDINRFIALIIVSYFLFRIWEIKNVIPKIVVTVALIYVAYVNIYTYLPYKDNSLIIQESEVKEKISARKRIEFQVGVPESYLYWYYMHQRRIEVY